MISTLLFGPPRIIMATLGTFVHETLIWIEEMT
jgi:hypothetical protein